MAEKVEEMPERDDKTVELIHSRLEKLQSQRQELASRLEQELKLALAPLDASIKELSWMLSQFTGEGGIPPEYRVFRRESPPAPQPSNVHQFQPARRAASSPADMPPPADVIPSPKSGTPVSTNEGILRDALRKKR